LSTLVRFYPPMLTNTIRAAICLNLMTAIMLEYCLLLPPPAWGGGPLGGGPLGGGPLGGGPKMIS
jgi:hypothetical protein